MNKQKSLKEIKDELRVARYTRKTYWGIMMAWSDRVRKLEKIELDMKKQESCTCGIGYNPMCSFHAQQVPPTPPTPPPQTHAQTDK